MYWTTWWLWRGACTRSHPELGRETSQRQWYFVLRRGRVGRCQVFQAYGIKEPSKPYLRRKTPLRSGRALYGLVTRVLGDAGWSSPVARQAHNLKVIGSNPIPATNFPKQNSRLGFPLTGCFAKNRLAHF